ncbi:MAG: SsrA-binding protein SmpB [Alphaproteobacteria bacterium]|nr:SsrA-binding protein SmpB [Alphaproteobacteria bacterium]
MAARQGDDRKIVARNRKARYNYHIAGRFEAGIALTGTEVKSLRQGRASMGEAYAVERGGEIFLINSHIAEYDAGGRYNHTPLRARKLLLRKREIQKLIGGLRKGGLTIARYPGDTQNFAFMGCDGNAMKGPS